ncbi:MAG: hypothetical protein J6C81_08715 [Muribaculaceae bacterium]|nr:hypothetical protein [Muribaculaceae bacterium]
MRHPKTLAMRINGFWVSDDFKPLNIDSVADVAMNFHTIFIKKAVDSAGGQGVICFKQESGKSALIEQLNKLDSNTVIQAGLTQHPEMSRLNPSSVNTVRVLSFLQKSGDVKILSTVVRMGRNGSYVDNASSGGVTVGVDASGRLKSVGYDIKGNKYYEHPDTKTRFNDVCIPDYTNIIKEIKVLQWQLCQFRLLSWDIAIDSDGQPVLIEVNMHSGQLDFHQLNNGPVFGEDTPLILEEVFGK